MGEGVYDLHFLLLLFSLLMFFFRFVDYLLYIYSWICSSIIFNQYANKIPKIQCHLCVCTILSPSPSPPCIAIAPWNVVNVKKNESRLFTTDNVRFFYSVYTKFYAQRWCVVLYENICIVVLCLIFFDICLFIIFSPLWSLLAVFTKFIRVG